MNVQEFSNQFDVLTNAYLNKSTFGNIDFFVFDEYEKSVFLTEAQEEIVLELYNGKNIFRDSFEGTEESRRFLNELINTYTTNEKVLGQTGLSSKSVFFQLPEDVWFITYESVTSNDSTLGDNTIEINVIPVTQDEFSRTLKNPFRGPSKDRVLRLDNKGNIVELISNYTIDRYLIKYIAKPTPIILVDFYDDLSINDLRVRTECALNPSIHRIILERAVQKAISSKVNTVNK